MRVLSPKFIVALTVGWSTGVSAQIPLPEGNVENLNLPLDLNAVATDPSVIWSHSEERFGSKYLRFHLSEIDDHSIVNYELKVVDRNNNEITISKAELSG